MEPANAEAYIMPSVHLTTTLPQRWQGDLLAVVVPEEAVAAQQNSSAGPLAELDAAFEGILVDVLTAGEFSGNEGQRSPLVRLAGGGKAKFLVLLGMGKTSRLHGTSQWSDFNYRALGALAAASAKAVHAQSVGLALLLYGDADLAVRAIRLVITGLLSGSWETKRFKTAAKPTNQLKEVHILAHSVSSEDAASSSATHPGVHDAEASVAGAMAEASGVHWARSLVDSPPNVCTPAQLAQTARTVANTAPDVFTLQVLGEQEVAQLGMGLFLGVAKGSDEPLQFIHLTYRATGDVNKKLALVGKGLTFDSGGYNLKTQGGIELMKIDMAGAAAVLGTARALSCLRPNGVEVHFIVAACENMISGRATRPSDILTSAAGKAVEVNDTDAEGRLTLADALWYAQEKCGATSIVDIATLTGACGIALGKQIGGLFASSDAVAAAVLQAAAAAGERFWRLPLEEGACYRHMLDSPSADMKNYAGPYGGAITAALFLKEFIRDGVEWAHLDVAGPVWDDKAGLPTGFGVSTLVHWVLAHAQGKQTS